MIFFLQNLEACWNSSGLSWFPSVKPRRPGSSAPYWTSSSTWRRPRGRRWSCVSNALSGPRQRREPSYDKLWRYEGHKQKITFNGVTTVTSYNFTHTPHVISQVLLVNSHSETSLVEILYLEQEIKPPVFQIPLSHSCFSAGAFVLSLSSAGTQHKVWLMIVETSKNDLSALDEIDFLNPLTHGVGDAFISDLNEAFSLCCSVSVRKRNWKLYWIKSVNCVR